MISRNQRMSFSLHTFMCFSEESVDRDVQEYKVAPHYSNVSLLNIRNYLHGNRTIAAITTKWQRLKEQCQ